MKLQYFLSLSAFVLTPIYSVTYSDFPQCAVSIPFYTNLCPLVNNECDSKIAYTVARPNWEAIRMTKPLRVNRRHSLTWYMRARRRHVVRQISAVRRASFLPRLTVFEWPSLCFISETAGLFRLAIQLCEPVGGTNAIGLGNISTCAVIFQLLQSLRLMLIIISNRV